MAATNQKWQIQGSNITQQALCGGGKFGSCLFVQNGYYGANSGIGISTNITSDVTVEFWLYYGPAAWRANWRDVFGNWQTASSNTGIMGFMVGATQTIFRVNGVEMFPSATPSTRWTDGLAQGWHHVALVRSGSTWNVYVDGTVQLTGTDPNPATPLNINAINLYVNAGSYGSGLSWMSEFRFTKMARYTANFTPPTAAFSLTDDPNAAQVEALLHFNNTDTFDATTRNVWATSGGVTLDNSIYKFGANSMKFDGTSGYMYSPINPDYWTITTGGFTIDCWVYVTGAGGVIYCGNSPGTTSFITIGLQNGTTFSSAGLIPCVQIETAGTYSYLTDGTTQVSQNAWNHIEFDYDGTTGYLFLNGTLLKSQAWTMINANGDTAMYIGVNRTKASAWYFKGNIDEFCITQGVARHTTNFTPNTAPYDLTTDPHAANIVCLMHMESLPIVYPNGQPVTDQQGLYAGIPIVCQLIDPSPLSMPVAFSLTDTSGGTAFGEYEQPAIHMTYGNAMFQPDSDDTRTQTQQALDWNSFGGFIAGTCIEQATPLDDVTVNLVRNTDYLQYSQQTTGAAGTFIFNDIQMPSYDGYYLISANPDPAILDQNAQVYSQMTATPYNITTTGSFTIGSGTTINSTVEIVGNTGPFTVTLASGTLPPGAVIQVNGRGISLTNATALASTGYVFSLNITGSLRGYSSVIQYELTQPTDLSLGTIVMQDGSWMGCQTPVVGSSWTGQGGVVLFKQATANRTALLHFDGTAGSNPIVDAMGNTWSVSGSNITLSSTQSVFGGTSWGGANGAGSQTFLYWSGYNWPPGNNVPWTVQFWFYVTSSVSAWQHLYGPYNTPNDSSLYVNGTNFYVYINGSQQIAVPITLGKWYFCVDQWDGVTRTTALNGTVVYTSNLNFSPGRNEFMLNYNENWNGIFVDEFSMVNGHALYTPSADVYTIGSGTTINTIPSTEFGTTFQIYQAW